MRKVTMLIGEPCVGKSEIIKELLTHGSWRFVKVPWTPHHYYEAANTVVLGRYDDRNHQFPGTDRLSMAVQPHAIKWITSAHGTNFIFEGDRLGNVSMIDALKDRADINLEVIQIWLLYEEMRMRRQDAGRNQSQEFLQRCRTKIRNVRKHCYEYDIQFTEMYNRLPQDRTRIVQHLLEDRM